MKKVWQRERRDGFGQNEMVDGGFSLLQQVRATIAMADDLLVKQEGLGEEEGDSWPQPQTPVLKDTRLWLSCNTSRLQT